MAEQLDLTAAQVITRTTYAIQFVHLDWRGGAQIVIGLLGSDGALVTAEYRDAAAVALLTALNTANLSVKSFQRRVLEKLALDGKLPAGVVSGVPI